MNGIYSISETILQKIKGIVTVTKSKIDDNGNYVSALFDYNGYKVAATACTINGTTITLPSNFDKCDYIYIVKDIDSERKRETFFIKMDDFEALPSEFEKSNPYIKKKISNKLKLEIKDLPKKKVVKNLTKTVSIF
jgi:hypothetical protein